MKRIYRGILPLLAVLAVVSVLFCAVSLADEVPTKYKEALAYAREKQPMVMDMGKVRLKLKELVEIKKALPEGARLKFSVKWQGFVLTDEDTLIDLKQMSRNPSAEEIENLIFLCPDVKTIDNSTHKSPSNNEMIPLIEKYPEIRFEWIVHIGKGKDYYCATTNTAWSTNNKNNAPHKVNGEDLELLKYVPGLKALDVGHNVITDLEFLRLFPDLELLIIGGNFDLKDLTRVGDLKHLQYLEIFDAAVEDLTPLAGCTELLDLNVTNTKVSDLSPLDGLASLERFWCNQNPQVTEEQRAHFRELHPDCVSMFDGKHATSENWRKHDRFYHYRKCFKSRKWIPFSEMVPAKK